jgi:hypothetical protein
VKSESENGVFRERLSYYSRTLLPAKRPCNRVVVAKYSTLHSAGKTHAPVTAFVVTVL